MDLIDELYELLNPVPEPIKSIFPGAKFVPIIKVVPSSRPPDYSTNEEEA